MLYAICPECELQIECKSQKPGSTFWCQECATKLEIIDVRDNEAVVDYADEDED